MDDVEKFLAQRALSAAEYARAEAKAAQYKQAMPAIEALWDTTAKSVAFNDLTEEAVSSGVSIFSCSAEELWLGIFKPDVYDANTLWTELHDAWKIARVISSWEDKVALTPIFLVKHGSLALGLVADGKHRLTVSRAIHTKQMPFMVAKASESWVSQAIPAAVRIDMAE